MANSAARDPKEKHRVATALELLFDVITVIAIGAVTAGLHHAISEGEGLQKLPVFVFLFAVIWWAWMNFTWFASAFDDDGPVYRVLVMVIMTGELIFAGGAGHIFKTLDIGWGVIGWTVMRLGLATLWFRTSSIPQHRATALRYGVGILIAQGGWIAFYFMAEPGTALYFPLAAAFFAVELMVPVFAEQAGRTPFHRHHIIERYGLLMIISLGEVMLGISAGFGALHENGLQWSVLASGLSGIVIVFAIFSIYFCEREHLVSRDLSTALIWGYGHVLIFGAVAAVGAGIGAESDIATAEHHTAPATASYWIGLSLALYFITLWFARDRHFSLKSRALALPVMAGSAIVAAFAGAPSWAFGTIALIATLWRVPLQGVRPIASAVGIAGPHE